jgi:hypothetical protein
MPKFAIVLLNGSRMQSSILVPCVPRSLRAKALDIADFDDQWMQMVLTMVILGADCSRS